MFTHEDESGRTIHPSEREFQRSISETFLGNKRAYFEAAVLRAPWN